MAEATCTAEDCPQPVLVKSRGLCRMHYLRWWKTGELGTAEPLLRPAPPECVIPDCDEIPHGRGLCAMHYTRWRKTGDPGSAQRQLSRNPSECIMDGCPGVPKAHGLCEAHYMRQYKTGDPGSAEVQRRPRGEELGYHGVHKRIYQTRGPATEHACQRCGDPAQQWAYDHGDPDERHDPKRGPYSMNPARYLPLCHRCHYKLDHGPERDKF